ncbi:hypothetical protein HJC23_011742 [Cyclotella cryptica]|uniref:O-GlcNAc transferase C-terminal domain-containing protein n=1 Tax=Cyclotella cryptica TaxID=29204 RepID=A0ABD3PG19_9STRA
MRLQKTLSVITSLSLALQHRVNAITIPLSPGGACVSELQHAKANSSDRNTLMRLAVCLHTNGNSAAFEVYQHILETRPDFAYTHVNLGAWYSTAGKPRAAIEHLEQYFHKVGGIYGDQPAIDTDAVRDGNPCRAESPNKRDCVNALNNLASVHFSEGKNSSAPLIYLTRAIEIGDEYMLTNVYANLGGHLSKITGNEDEAADAYIKGFWISLEQGDLDSAIGLLARRALLVPTVASSIENVEKDRIKFKSRVRDITELAQLGGSKWIDDVGDLFRLGSGVSTINGIRQIPRLSGKLRSWTTGVQTPHFFVHYKGYYDLPIQQAVSTMFTELCPSALFEVSSHLVTPNNESTATMEPSEEKRRVGFISSFIGDDEPHGLLVLDVIRSLSRTDIFDFFVISIGAKSPSSEFYRAAKGNVYTTGFDDSKARNLLKSLKLDCLVYLEAMNDATIYFLGYQRYAQVQILVMGSPVTSGVPTFDYFISGDLLEHPFRTQLRDEHYSEQVVLFEGQAISFPETQFHPLQDSALAAGDAISLSNHTSLDKMRILRRKNAHIYLCFQSVFKIQPSFDHVLADILQADYQGHIVLQASRHAHQTSSFDSRIKAVLEKRFCNAEFKECPAMKDAYSRVHFIARVTSDKVLKLMQQSSVILHPFPFGGSKTAFDAINAGIPLVTYPQRYLRGRMAAVVLRFMDLHEVDPDAATCCIADTSSDYVSKAIRLASDENYRFRVSQAFRERRKRIFDDKFIALEWGKLLTRALGVRVTEEDLISKMGYQRGDYQHEEYFAKKVKEEQSRWRQSVMLSDILSPH